MEMMKSSNTEWLGDIPAEWDIAQIGNYYEHRNKKVSDYEFMPLSVTMKGIVPQLATAAKSDDHSNRKLVKKGDFVINSRSDRRGSCGISPLDGSVSLINTVMEPRGEINPQYYNWLFHTEQFADEFYKWGHGIVDDLWTTHWQEMKKILIVAPSLDEQQAIADYLDETCSKIDEIIAEAKASVDECKKLKQSVIFETVTKGLNKNAEMKDSEYDFIGDIPDKWEMCKIRHLGIPQNGISIGGEAFGSGYPFVSYSDVYKNYSLPKKVDKLVQSSQIDRKKYSVEKGDWFFTRTSETIEEVGFSCVCEETIPDAVFAGFLIRVRPFNNRIYTGFAKYYFRSVHLRSFFVKEMNLVTRASLDQGLLKNTPVVVPPYDEQVEIANYLEDRCKTIDGIIENKESIIIDLEAYKKSLIYEVVTGKRRVV